MRSVGCSYYNVIALGKNVVQVSRRVEAFSRLETGLLLSDRCSYHNYLHTKCLAEAGCTAGYRAIADHTDSFSIRLVCSITLPTALGLVTHCFIEAAREVQDHGHNMFGDGDFVDAARGGQ